MYIKDIRRKPFSSFYTFTFIYIYSINIYKTYLYLKLRRIILNNLLFTFSLNFLLIILYVLQCRRVFVFLVNNVLAHLYTIYKIFPLYI